MRKTIAALSAATIGAALAVAAPLAASATGGGYEQKCYATETHTTYSVEEYVETAPATPDTLAPRFDYSETRATGHFEAVESGLHIWTEGSTSTDKVALYRFVSVPLGSITGTPSVEYTATTGITPGSQVVVDFDGDGTSDGILINEPVYGDAAWLSNSAAQFVKDGAPHTGGGYGSNWYGTVQEWAAAFPYAKATAVGFSLGSGVLGDGIVHGVQVGGTSYGFTQTTPGTPATYAWVATGETGHALTLPADTETTRYVATGTKDVRVKVDCAPKPEPIVSSTDDATKDCTAGTITTVTTTSTTGWTFDRYTNTWSKTEPVVTTASSVRDATAEECPVTPTPTPTDTATPAPVVAASTTGLAQTGADPTVLLWSLTGGALAAAIGALLVVLGLRRRQVSDQK
ncbi:hypothetical protein PBI_GINA_86 [Microbacterium phage Gina]|nr:hypothetical protein PBI_GINA_86 [Microbacterium phage Gina]